MTDHDVKLVEMLRKLIDNVQRGNLESLGVQVADLGGSAIELSLKLQGKPDRDLRYAFEVNKG